MAERERNSKKIKYSIILSLFFSISIILIILYFTLDAEAIQQLSTRKFRYEFFIAAAAFNLVYWGLWGARLKILSNAVDHSQVLSLRESTKIVIANLFLANITPSMAGGEPVRIYLLKKNGFNVGDATAVVIGERLLDALFFLISVPFAIFIFGRYLTEGYLQIGVVIAIIFFSLIFGLFSLALKYPKKIKKILIKLAKKFGKITNKETPKQIFEKISNEVDNFHNSMTYFLTKGKKTFLKAGIITALFWISGWVIPIFLLIGLGINDFFIESCAAQIILVIIAMIPTTPGSSGVSEGGLALLYRVFIPSSLLGVFVLLYRFITYHLGLIFGAIFQYRIFKSITSISMENVKEKQE